MHICLLRICACLAILSGPRLPSTHWHCGRDTLKQAAADLAQLQKREAEARRALEQKERRMADTAASVEDILARISGLNAELGTEMLAQLSSTERKELATLAPQLTQLKVHRSI